MTIRLTALLLVATLLGGCASVRLIDSEVRSFSKLEAVAPGATYRFERLPSQQNQPQAQAALEAMAAAALAKVGLQLAPEGDAKPTYTALLGARSERDDAASPNALLYTDPFFGLAGRSYGGVRGHGFYGSLFWVAPVFPPPYYKREVSLLLRDTATNAPVYETRARHEGPWADTEQIFPAMLGAALQGFPKPPEGERNVSVEIPR